jgi:hypothetical protein
VISCLNFNCTCRNKLCTLMNKVVPYNTGIKDNHKCTWTCSSMKKEFARFTCAVVPVLPQQKFYQGHLQQQINLIWNVISNVLCMYIVHACMFFDSCFWTHFLVSKGRMRMYPGRFLCYCVYAKIRKWVVRDFVEQP